MREPQQEILGFIRERGLDLELAVASTLRNAGFSIAQSVGVTDHAATESAHWSALSGAPSDAPEHDGREIDVVAACTVERVTVAFIVECKTLQRSKLVALEFVPDSAPLQPQPVSIDGRVAGLLPSDPVPLRIEHECRAFKLVSKPDKGDHSSEHDPVWRIAPRNFFIQRSTRPTKAMQRPRGRQSPSPDLAGRTVGCAF